MAKKLTWEDLQGRKREGIKYGVNKKPVENKNKVSVSVDESGVRTIKGPSSSYTTQEQLKSAVNQQKQRNSIPGRAANTLLALANSFTGNQAEKLKLPGLPSLRNIAKGELGKNYKKDDFYKLGEYAGYVAPIGGAEAVAAKVLPKAVQGAKYGKLATAATAGALQGAGLSTTQEVGNAITGESQGLKPALANIAINTGVGAAGAAALHGIGKGVEKAVGKYKLNKRIKNARNADYVGETTVRPQNGVRYNPNQLPGGQKLALGPARSNSTGFFILDENGKIINFMMSPEEMAQRGIRTVPKYALPEGKLALPGMTRKQAAEFRMKNPARSVSNETVVPEYKDKIIRKTADGRDVYKGPQGEYTLNEKGNKIFALPSIKTNVRTAKLNGGRTGALEDAFRLTAIEARTRGFDPVKDIGKIKQIFKTYAPKKGDNFTDALEEYKQLLANQGRTTGMSRNDIISAIARSKDKSGVKLSASAQRDVADYWRKVVGRDGQQIFITPSDVKLTDTVPVRTNLKQPAAIKRNYAKAIANSAERQRLRAIENAQAMARQDKVVFKNDQFEVRQRADGTKYALDNKGNLITTPLFKKEVMKYVGEPSGQPTSRVKIPKGPKPVGKQTVAESNVVTPATPKQEVVQPQVEQTNLPSVRGNEPPTQPPTQVAQQTEQLALPQSNKKTYTSRSDSTDINEYSDLKRTIDKEGRNVDKLRAKMDKLASDIEANDMAGRTKQNIKLKQDLEDMKNEFRQSLQELDIAQTRMNELNLSQFHFTDNLKDYTVENIENFVRKTVKDGDLIKLADVKLPRMKNIYEMNEAALKNTDNPFHNNIVREMLKAKGEKAIFESNELDRMSKSFGKFKFKAGTKESAAIQDFGEGKVSQMALVKKFGEEKAQAIVDSAKEFKKMYKEYLDKANSVLRALGEPEIQERQDYFHHIVELENYFKGFDWVNHAMGYDQKLAPKIKQFGFFKRRTSENYKSDAIGAMLNYIPGVSHTIHMNRMAKVFNVISNMAGKEAEAISEPIKKQSLIKISDYFGDYAKSIQGIPYSAARKGSGLFKAFNWADKYIGTATRKAQLFGNLSTLAMQAANLPLTAGEAGFRNTGKAMLQSLYHAVGKEGTDPIERSEFFKERKLHMKYWKYGKSTFKDPTKFARFMLMATDATSSQISWRAFYNQALEKGMKNPIEFADKMARDFNPSREIGDLPMAYQDVIGRTFIPYAYEPMKVMGKLYKNLSRGQFLKLTKTLVAFYAMNQGYNFLMGRSGTVDPIGAVQRGIKEGQTTKDKAIKAGLYTAGDIASNTPGVGLLLKEIFPTAKIRIGDETYTFKEIFQESDPTRYATNPLVLTAIINATKEYNQSGGLEALAKLSTGLIPMGSQISKTYDGILALQRGGKFKNDKLYFPVEKTVGNVGRAIAFGTSATKEGQKFYKTPDIPKPLSEKQTQRVVESGNLKRGFTEQMYIRQIDNLSRQISEEKDQQKKLELSKKRQEIRTKLIMLRQQ